MEKLLICGGAGLSFNSHQFIREEEEEEEELDIHDGEVVINAVCVWGGGVPAVGPTVLFWFPGNESL